VRDAETIIHANARDMAVALEGMRAALERIAAGGTALHAVKRAA
jgi:hypothetical protein